MAPQPTARHHKLHAPAGAWTWIGDEVLAEKPWMPGGAATGFVHATLCLDGVALQQGCRQERDGRDAIRAEGPFTFDLDWSEYRLFRFGYPGFDPAEPAGGTWEGDTLTVFRKSARDVARHTFVVRRAREYEHGIENSWDGGAGRKPVMTGFRRRRSGDSPHRPTLIED